MRKHCWGTLWLLVVIFYIAGATKEEKSVESSIGIFHGITEQGVNIFRGIKYASVASRWSNSVLIEKYKKPVNASSYGLKCPQFSFGNFAPNWSGDTDEDCLFLNIWAPSTNLTGPMPVLVFIHAGGFLLGSGMDSYMDGSHLAKSNIVVVSLNYRLGIFGFFAHPALTKEDTNQNTNFGIYDQMVALEWIQRHIAAFGGDPNSVTIYGETSILFLLTAKKYRENPPFKRAIISSPLPLITGVRTREEVYNSTKVFQKIHNCETGTIDQQLECLRHLSQEKVQQTPFMRRKLIYHSKRDPFILFPIIDNFQWEDSPFRLILDGHFSKSIDIIIGNVRDEGSLFTSYPFMLSQIPKEVVQDALHIFSLDANQHFHKNDFSLLENLYPETQENHIKAIAKVFGHVYIDCPTRRLAFSFQNYSNGNIYRYYFTYGNTWKHLGAFRGSEFPFVFQTTPGGLYPRTFTVEDEQVSRHISRYFVEFVKKGSPLAEGLPDWPSEQVLKEKKQVFVIDSSAKVDVDPVKQVCEELWDRKHERGISFVEGANEFENEPLTSTFLNVYLVQATFYFQEIGMLLLIFVAVLFYHCCCVRNP